MQRSRATNEVMAVALLALLCCAGPAASARRLPHRAVTGTPDGTHTKQPRLHRPYARGVKTQPDGAPPPPTAVTAPPSSGRGNTTSSSSSGGGSSAASDSGGKPNLGAILAGSILGVGLLCAVVACLLVRLCLRITGPPLPERPPTVAAASAAPTAMDLPVIVIVTGQHVTHPDGTFAGAIESSSSSSSSSSSRGYRSECSECSEQQGCLEAGAVHGA